MSYSEDCVDSLIRVRNLAYWYLLPDNIKNKLYEETKKDTCEQPKDIHS